MTFIFPNKKNVIFTTCINNITYKKKKSFSLHDAPPLNNMASKITPTLEQSPKHQGSNNNSKMIGSDPNGTPKGGGPPRQCLCSPTMHKGSFRCRLHRSLPSLYRSKSTPSSTTRTLANSQVQANWRNISERFTWIIYSYQPLLSLSFFYHFFKTNKKPR
jgi:hypothetical protein